MAAHAFTELIANTHIRSSTRTQDVKLHLYTTLPNAANTGGVEVTGGSYVAKSVPIASTNSEGDSQSSAEVLFDNLPTATIVGGALKLANGTLVDAKSFPAPISVTAGQNLRFAPGDIRFLIS